MCSCGRGFPDGDGEIVVLATQHVIEDDRLTEGRGDVERPDQRQRQQGLLHGHQRLPAVPDRGGDVVVLAGGGGGGGGPPLGGGGGVRAGGGPGPPPPRP